MNKRDEGHSEIGFCAGSLSRATRVITHLKPATAHVLLLLLNRDDPNGIARRGKWFIANEGEISRDTTCVVIDDPWYDETVKRLKDLESDVKRACTERVSQEAS